MVRIVIICSAVVIAMLSCLSQVPVLAEQQSARYIDKADHYSLALPSGWTQNMEIRRPYVAFLGPDEHGFQPNFSVYSEPSANRTLAEYVKVARAAIIKNKQMHLLGAGKVRVGGTPAELIQSNVSVPGHPQSIARQVLTVRNGRGYMLTLIAPPSAIKRLTPTFDRVISSFRWER